MNETLYRSPARLCRAMLLLVPTHRGHLAQTITLVTSVLTGAVDGALASLRLVVGGADEVELFEGVIRSTMLATSDSGGRLWDTGVASIRTILAHYGIDPRLTLFPATIACSD